jgi:hypothetical protein
MTQRTLEFHVVLDLIERNVTRALYHYLAPIPPSAFCQFSESPEFPQLSRITGDSQTTGAEAVTE